MDQCRPSGYLMPVRAGRSCFKAERYSELRALILGTNAFSSGMLKWIFVWSSYLGTSRYFDCIAGRFDGVDLRTANS